MSKTYINAALRREVVDRAGGCCEYCLFNTEDKGIDFAIDHIIAEKHGGATQSDNLCLTCYWCNSYKGSDISSVDWDYDKSIVPLFNPRQQQWEDHFRLDGALFIPLSPPGRVTVFLLHLNATESIQERHLLIALGVYPCSAADVRQK
ncbi:MAG: HNH endonuclease signature motif containing protein [bacterium]|nr:HNH endonuclease signature motif containing protein [bacterium]